MPSGKIIAVALIAIFISIVIIGLFYGGVPGVKKLGVTPGQSPISISQVALAPGGSLQGKYAVRTYWDVSLEANSETNFAAVELNGNGANGTALSDNSIDGQTVVPSSQVYVSVEELQPYAWVQLVPQQMTFAPSVSGYNETIVIGQGGQSDLITVPASTQAQTFTFYEASGPVHVVYPVKVSVQVTGNNSWSSSSVFDMSKAEPGQVCDPNDPAQCVQVNSLGLFLGSTYGPTGLSDTADVYYQAAPECANWCGWQDASTAIQSGYPSYWFGPERSFSVSSGEGSPDTNYFPYSPNCPSSSVVPPVGYPGWAQSVSTPQALGSASYYRYYPVPPEIGVQGGVTHGSVESQTGYGPGIRAPVPYTVTNTVCGGLDLSDYLATSGVQNTNWTGYYGLGTSINSTALVVNMPLGWDSAGYPTMNIDIPTTVANTIIYQVNNAHFGVSSIATSIPSTFAGGSIKVSATVTDTSSFGGTAQMSVTQSVNAFEVTPTGQGINLGAGGSSTVTFTMTGLQTAKDVNDSVCIVAENASGQVTGSKCITIEDMPQPNGAFLPEITGVSPKSVSITVGQSQTVTVSLQNIGVEGTAIINASSEAPVIAGVAPSRQNLTLGAGGTSSVSIYIVGVEKGNTTVDVLVSNGTKIVSTTKIPVTVGGGGLLGPCLISCPPPQGTPWYLNWQIWVELLMISAAAAAAFVFAYRRQ